MKLGLALGSNLGDRLEQLRRAKTFLSGLSRHGWCLASPVYETEPVDCPPDSPAFFNAVMEIEYDEGPPILLQKTQAYEAAAGRERNLPRNAARTIDIDILYCGNLEMQEPDLILPHPRLAERRFVLLPLSKIRPDLIVGGTSKTVAALLKELPKGGPRVTLRHNNW
jgi:2-amino-4-hydroxy-6-hydroxymethyldihydropteridine diphosphokinase